MKKLLIYIENYIYGGLEKFLFDFVENIKNVEIFLFFNKDNLRIKDFALKKSIDYKLTSIRKNILPKAFNNRIFQSFYKSITQFTIYFNRIYNYFYLKKLFKDYLNYDNLLIINGGYPAADSCSIASIVGKKLGFKNILFTILSTPVDYSKYKIIKFLERYFDKKVMNSVNFFIGNCNLIKNELNKKRNFKLNKLKTIYTGIKTKDNIKKSNSLQNDFISLKKEKDEIWIGTVGYLYDIKGQKFLIDSLKLMDVKKLKLHCLIVGGGPDLNKLRNLTKENGLEDYIIITGKYPYSIEDIYLFIDIFILPSLHEGLPYTISEALMFKLPVIATKVGGIPEQIQNNVNGFLVEPKKSNDIVDALKSLIEIRDQWEKIGNLNFEKAKATFSIEKMIIDYAKLLI